MQIFRVLMWDYPEQQKVSHNCRTSVKLEHQHKSGSVSGSYIIITSGSRVPVQCNPQVQISSSLTGLPLRRLLPVLEPSTTEMNYRTLQIFFGLLWSSTCSIHHSAISRGCIAFCNCFFFSQPQKGGTTRFTA